MSRHTISGERTKRARTIWYSVLVIGGFVAGLVTPALALVLDANGLPFALTLVLPVAAYLSLLLWGRRADAWERSVGTVLFLVAALAGATVLPSWVMQQKHAASLSPPNEN